MDNPNPQNGQDTNTAVGAGAAPVANPTPAEPVAPAATAAPVNSEATTTPNAMDAPVTPVVSEPVVNDAISTTLPTDSGESSVITIGETKKSSGKTGLIAGICAAAVVIIAIVVLVIVKPWESKAPTTGGGGNTPAPQVNPPEDTGVSVLNGEDGYKYTLIPESDEKNVPLEGYGVKIVNWETDHTAVDLIVDWASLNYTFGNVVLNTEDDTQTNEEETETEIDVDESEETDELEPSGQQITLSFSEYGIDSVSDIVLGVFDTADTAAVFYVTNTGEVYYTSLYIATKTNSFTIHGQVTDISSIAKVHQATKVADLSEYSTLIAETKSGLGSSEYYEITISDDFEQKLNLLSGDYTGLYKI